MSGGLVPDAKQVLRGLLLAVLTVGMILLLTAVQITHAFLGATGGASGVSAVAIRDEAQAFERYSKRRKAIIESISGHQDRRAEALSIASDASVFQYFHKVQFRRFVFACYPKAQRDAQTTFGEEGKEISGLSWDFLLSVYQAAAEGAQPVSCPSIAVQSTEALKPMRASDLDHGELFRACAAASSTPRDQLECLWNNVTFSVGLEEMAQQRRQSVETELQARKAALSELDGELLGSKAFADPSGRAAVAAWLELNGASGARELPAADGAAARLIDAIGRFPGWLIATIVTFPVLAQSAALALLAGAVGGGVARCWELLGFRTLNPKALEAAARALTEKAQQSDQERGKEMADLAQEIENTKAAIANFTADQLRNDNGPVLTACASGAGSALILWLLTTSGLFVLSGGDNVASASPSVLLAISLAAGLAYKQVIGLIFKIAEGVVDRGQAAA